MSEAPKHPTSLVVFQRAISIELVFEDPFPSNHIGLGRTGDKIPSVVGLKCYIFVFHGPAPMRISKSITAGPREWTEGLGMQGKTRLPVPCFSTGRHTMGVGDRWNGDSTIRDRRVALDIARWRRDHAGTSSRGPCRALESRGRDRSTPAVDVNDGRLQDEWCGERLSGAPPDTAGCAGEEGAWSEGPGDMGA